MSFLAEVWSSIKGWWSTGVAVLLGILGAFSLGYWNGKDREHEHRDAEESRQREHEKKVTNDVENSVDRRSDKSIDDDDRWMRK